MLNLLLDYPDWWKKPIKFENVVKNEKGLLSPYLKQMEFRHYHGGKNPLEVFPDLESNVSTFLKFITPQIGGFPDFRKHREEMNVLHEIKKQYQKDKAHYLATGELPEG